MSIDRNVSVLPIKKQYTRSDYFEASLASHGLTRVPGTGYGLCPSMDVSGKYLTGLDENARSLNILKQLDETEYKKEVKRIQIERKELEDLTGLDLSPKSDYYKSISSTGGVKITDEGIVLNLNKPEDRITLLWLKNHVKVAPSYEQWMLGGDNITPDMEFYIADEDVASKTQFSNKKKINSLIIKIDSTTAHLRLKYAKLLGIKVNDLSSEEDVYNKLDEYIKGGVNNIKEIERVMSLTEALVDLKVTVKDCYTYNVIRAGNGGAVIFGNDKIANNMADLEDFLLDSNNSEVLVNLKDALKDRKKQSLIRN